MSAPESADSSPSAAIDWSSVQVPWTDVCVTTLIRFAEALDGHVGETAEPYVPPAQIRVIAVGPAPSDATTPPQLESVDVYAYT